MEVTITDFRNNISTYFDKAYFGKEEIILKRRGYKVKISPYIDEETEETPLVYFGKERIEEFEEYQDEKNFNNAVKSDSIRSKLSILASKL